MTVGSKKLQQLLARPAAVRVHFEAGLRHYERGELEGLVRHRTALGMLPEGGGESLPYLALKWRELWLQGGHEAALTIVRQAAARFPEDADTALELADVLNDLGYTSDALTVLAKAAHRASDDADLWYELGLTAEALGQGELRKEAFRRVWGLEQAWEPARRVWLSEERMRVAVKHTLGRLPPLAQGVIGNITIVVEDYPEEWIFDTGGADPRIMGLFRGPESGRSPERASTDYVPQGSPTLYLYRWNIERVCGTPEEVEAQVEMTVLHEVGHYLGLDEEALHFQGLG